MKLTRDSLYRQARSAILDIIKQNTEFMSKLPSEQELAEMLGVSRNTVREAIKSLENEGYLVSRHGVGTFIIYDGKNIKTNIAVLESITNIIVNHGYKPGTKSIYCQKRQAPSVISKILNLEENDDVLYIERVRTADDDPVIYIEDYIPYIDGMYEKYQESKDESLFNFLQNFGQRVAFSNSTIRAVLSSKHIQNELSLDGPETLLLLQQVHYTAKGDPVLYSDSYFLSKKFEFNVVRKRLD
ncbi:GntR family transcriptional regulator [Tepidimicrobium xylanilyticum]|uniref:GntR family transcriptional regulator n=1 Tax=Tepidimicrobium xylanilyticum TaxID=1123352 RepID=A0A1H2QN76_9FIRM|nr:GntR family transcriptional regulator [Tepidimicrobium xylanilyticum]GMG95618.1 putative HTH-type transcriptional regulator YmfC [Tepidimicrobium xylanilyticum]SDW08653.1 GntR family transcriptional regulator [Tepidimicrobium xylanilyticum]